MNTQQRIDEIMYEADNFVIHHAVDTQLLRLMLEALVMEARNEELKLQLEQLKK